MSSNAAIEMLRSIRASTIKNALPLPLKSNAQAQWQGLGYQIGGVRLVSPMGEISEILKVPRLAKLPVVKSWVRGIANVRGRLIPVIDLHDYLGMPNTLPTAQWRMLIVEDRDLVAGLIVEQSLGIQHFLEDSFEPAGDDVIESLRPYVAGAFRHGGRVFYQMNLQAILRDEKFFDVALDSN
jgi:twitching motility protein PilI